MDELASPEYVIGPMRILTMSEMSFFHVTSARVPFANLDQVLDP